MSHPDHPTSARGWRTGSLASARFRRAARRLRMAQNAPSPPTPVQGNVQTLMQDDKQWPMAAKNYANTRFSSLDQINAGNVGQLKLAWTFSVGAPRGQEAAPLAVNGTVFVVAPYAGVHPNQVFALDAATGDLEMVLCAEAQPRRAGRRLLRCGHPRPRLRQRQDLPQHARRLCSRASTPTPARSSGTPSSATSIMGETITMAPLVVKGKVLVGNSGGEMGVRGWLTALDENTGKIVWRAYSTGPGFRGADRRRLQAALRLDEGQGSRRQELAAGQVADRRRHRLGLDFVRSRSQSDLLRHRPIPGTWNHDQRPGDNLWTSTHLRPRSRHRQGQVGLSDRPARSVGLRRDQREHSGRSRHQQPAAQGADPSRSQRLHVCDRPRRPARCSRPIPTTPSTPSKAIDLKTGRPVLNDEPHAHARQDGRETSARPRPARRTGSRRPGRRAPSCSTCRISTSA